jgi:hypothetical protein
MVTESTPATDAKPLAKPPVCSLGINSVGGINEHRHVHIFGFKAEVGHFRFPDS